ncbi:kinase-like protein [Phlegmacium glaucopus]|nr:kinase-like protein [Phlegmacium glaucopus]
MSTSVPTSPSSRALITLPVVHTSSWSTSTSSNNVASTSAGLIEQEQWQPILHASNQVVLYNPRSHALSITSTSAPRYPAVVVTRRKRNHDTEVESRCPYCKQSLPAGFVMYDFGQNVGMNADDEHIGAREENQGDQHSERWNEGQWNEQWPSGDERDDEQFETVSTDPAYHSRASDYFQLLAIANERSTAISSTPHAAYRVGTSSTFVRADDERSGNVLGDGIHRGSTMPTTDGASSTFQTDKMAEGYFKTFFQEEYKLGMGANGSVFLCQHVLDGNPLGHFGVKKIAVGNSPSYLLKILREVRLLERLHHPNIIAYHHAWLESCQFSSFGPTVPTLHVLMQWAEGGSLDDFIDTRLGRKPANVHLPPFGSAPVSSRASTTPSVPPDSPTFEARPLMSDPGVVPINPTQQTKHAHFANNDSLGNVPQSSQDPLSRSARIRAFRAYQHASPEEKERMKGNWSLGLGPDGPSGTGRDNSGARTRGEWTAVHLLSADEVRSLFKDVVEGLRFLHSKSILHLDLKPGNVLLTWDEGRLMYIFVVDLSTSLINLCLFSPRAMLSDFGTSRDMLKRSRVRRSGNTGTLEYSAPESLPSPLTGILKETDSKADMWSLGMILHKLLFFKLPYRYAAVGDANGEPISRENEGEKMERLEREVLDYPGFKSNPNLVSGFEARRLPRAFLVLLENLLHKTPAVRPSSEKVATAIRDGKLDPLEEGNVTDNLPLTRLRMDNDTGDEFSHDINNAHEKAKLLALPSPTDVFGPEEGSWRSWLSLSWWLMVVQRRKRWIFRRQLYPRGLGSRGGRGKRWQILGMRVLRSCLLIVKISTIPRLCPDPTTRLCPAISTMYKL